MKRLLPLLLMAAMLSYACGNDETDNTIPENNIPDASSNNTEDTDDDGHTYSTGNFMDGFFIPQKMIVTSETNSFRLRFLDLTGTNMCEDESIFFYTNDAAKGDMYKNYAKYYSDTTYSFEHSLENNYIGCVYPLACINITVDKDFDEAHLANTSVNELFSCDANFYYEYILNGYFNSGSKIHNMKDETKELSEMAGLKLMDYDLWFSLKQKPATPGTYTFTVSITFDPDPVTGKTISLEPATTTITFE